MNRRTIIAGITSLPILLAARTGSAQTPTTGTIPPLAELEGLEAAVSRTWGLDVEGMLAATPDLKIEEFTGTTSLTALVARFDSAEHAIATYDAYASGVGSQLMAMGQGGTPTVDEEPLPEIGDTAAAATLHTVSGDFETWWRYVLVQRGEYFFLTSALANAEEAATDADGLARYLATEGAEEGNEAIFVAEGGSTGGLWGFMPETGHESLANLVPIFDETLFPPPPA